MRSRELIDYRNDVYFLYTDYISFTNGLVVLLLWVIIIHEYENQIILIWSKKFNNYIYKYLLGNVVTCSLIRIRMTQQYLLILVSSSNRKSSKMCMHVDFGEVHIESILWMNILKESINTTIMTMNMETKLQFIWSENLCVTG